MKEVWRIYGGPNEDLLVAVEQVSKNIGERFDAVLCDSLNNSLLIIEFSRLEFDHLGLKCISVNVYIVPLLIDAGGI